jgi:Tol biopolymer transport system component
MNEIPGEFPLPAASFERHGRLLLAHVETGGKRRKVNRLALVAGIVLAAALLASPALSVGERLLDLVQSKRKLSDVQAPAWSRDGRSIVFVSWRDGNGEIYVMDAEGGEARNLTRHPAKDVRPAWSPDGRRIAFVSHRDGQSEVYVMEADGSEKRNLTRNAARDVDPVWSPDGRRIAFVRGHLKSKTVPGLGVHRYYSYGLYVVNADGGGLRRLTRAPTFNYQVVWSPDGQAIYFGRYLVRTDGSGARRLPHIPLTAVWSPDGTRIVFVGTFRRCCPDRPYNSEIYVMNADGGGLRRLTRDAGFDGEPAWSPDGTKIAFRSNRDGNNEIYVMNADGTALRNLTRNTARDSRPSWSPDGKKLAFISNRDGRAEAHVMNADGTGQRRLTQGGS